MSHPPQTAQHPQTNVQAQGHPQRWWILGVLCLSLVLVVAGNSGVNVALPTLVRELGATQTELQWIVDSYALVFAGLLLPAGALGDRFGRKRALQTGLVIFAACSVWASFATNAGQIIVARAVMGGGAALVMPSTLSTLTTVFSPAQRGQAIAIWAGFAGVGGAIGPVMSGILLEQFSWNAVFLINIPIIVVALLAGAILVPPSHDPDHRPLDPVGSALSVIGLAGLLFGIIEGPEQGWTDPATLAGFAAAVIFLPGFVLWELRAKSPMVDFGWFRMQAFSTGAATLSLAFFAFVGVIFMLTQYFQFVLGFSPLVAGFAQLPMPASVLYTSPRTAGLVARYGPRKVVSAGLLLLFAGMLYLGTLTGVDTPYLLAVPGIMLVGAAIALSTAPSTTLILASLPIGKAGVGSAVNDVTRQFGASIGVAILGSVLTATYRSGINAAALPPEIIERARVSIGAALDIAQDASAEISSVLDTTARQAFTDGFHGAMFTGAGVALVAALLIYRFGPDQTPRQER